MTRPTLLSMNAIVTSPARIQCVFRALLFILVFLSSATASTPVVPPEFRPNFSGEISDNQIESLRIFRQPLAPMEEPVVSGENQALGSAIMRFCSRTRESDTSALEEFVSNFPSSRWNASLCLNIGHWKYTEGSFSKALEFWEKAWTGSKFAKDYPAKFIRDAAAAQVGRMNARLGNRDWLDSFVTELKSMDIAGSAAESLVHTNDALVRMHSNPSECFMCGPYALLNILPSGVSTEVVEAIRRPQSSLQGTSLAQVHELSKLTGKSYQPAFRTKGAKILTAAVAHWKVGHFGALVEEKEGGLLIKDPTFGDEILMAPQVFELESSGYFLVPAGDLPEGWRVVDDQEASTVWGKGFTVTKDIQETRTDSISVKGKADCKKNTGMAVYDIQAMLVSLTISDTPVTYSPAFGPEVRFTLHYSQRDVAQPDNKNYSNLGMQWTHNYLAYLTPSGTTATIAEPGGGSTTFDGFVSATGAFNFQKRSASRLVKESPTRFVRTFADGSKQVFATFDGSRYFLTEIVNRIGHTVTLNYDSLFRLVKITDAAGMETRLGYDGQDLKIRSITDPFGRSGLMGYDSSGRLVSITDPVGIVSRFTYSSANPQFIEAMETPYGTTSFAFGDDGTNRWIEVTDPAGDKERTEYRGDTPEIAFGKSDPSGTIPSSTTTSYLNYRNTFYWDKKAYAEAKDDYTKAVIYHWCHEPPGYSQTSGVLESIKRPFESRICYLYSGQSDSKLVDSNVFTARPARILRKVGLGSAAQDTQEYSYTFNALGLPLTAKDPMGRETRFTYDPTNNRDLTAVEQKNGSVWDRLAASTYDSRGLPLTITDAAGQTTALFYNTQGQLLTATNPKGETVTNSYDSLGRLISINGPLPGSADTVTIAYDPVVLTRIRSITDPEGRTTTFEFDNLDRPTKVTYPDGQFEQITYNRLDPEWLRDRAGRWTRVWHNSIRQRVALMDPAQRLTQFTWCRCGDLKSLTDGNGNTTLWKHDVGGRIFEKVFADGSKESYLYDLAGRLQKVTPPSGKARDYAYFQDDSLKSLTYPEGSGNATISRTYGSSYPRIESMTDPTGVSTWSYHPVGTAGAGMVASVDGPLAEDTIFYHYDELGRMVRSGLTGGMKELTFDSAGRVTAEVNPLGNFTYTYEGVTGRLSAVAAPNGLVSAFTYHAAPALPRLASINHSAAGNPVSSFSYTYDKAGNIASWHQNQGQTSSTWGVEMDPVDQLLSVVGGTSGTQSFSYDEGGNRLTKQAGENATSFTYNSLNQLVQQTGGGKVRVAGTTSEPSRVSVQGAPAKMLDSTNFVAYPQVSSGNNSISVTATDGSGNARTNSYRITVPSSPTGNFTYDANGNLLSDGELTYGWDSLDRLIRVTKGSETFEFGYDGMNRRVIEKLNGTTTKRWVWNGLSIIQERNGDNAVVRSFYGSGIKDGSENIVLTRDHLGSVREAIDASGVVKSRYQYGPWGERTNIGVASYDVPLGFTGHFVHGPTELVLAPYRSYAPSQGRWLSRDPIAENGGNNLYAYVSNNSINLYDPTGKIEEELKQSGLYYVDETKNDIIMEAAENLSDSNYISEKPKRGIKRILAFLGGIFDGKDAVDNVKNVANVAGVYAQANDRTRQINDLQAGLKGDADAERRIQARECGDLIGAGVSQTEINLINFQTISNRFFGN